MCCSNSSLNSLMQNGYWFIQICFPYPNNGKNKNANCSVRTEIVNHTSYLLELLPNDASTQLHLSTLYEINLTVNKYKKIILIYKLPFRYLPFLSIHTLFYRDHFSLCLNKPGIQFSTSIWPGCSLTNQSKVALLWWHFKVRLKFIISWL